MDEAESNCFGEEPLIRMQRLMMRAATANGNDRRRLNALIADVEAERRELLRRRDHLQEEMRRSKARAAAIGAYLRSSAGRP